MRTRARLRGRCQTAVVADPTPQLPHVVPHHEELVPLPLSVPEYLTQSGGMRPPVLIRESPKRGKVLRHAAAPVVGRACR